MPQVEKTIEDFKSFAANMSSSATSVGSNGTPSADLPPVRGSDASVKPKTTTTVHEEPSKKNHPLPKDAATWSQIDKDIESENFDKVCREKGTF